MDQKSEPIIPTVAVKLTTKGVYVWSISLSFGEGGDSEFVVTKIKEFDTKLKDAFPAHAKMGTGRVANFDAFSEE